MSALNVIALISGGKDSFYSILHCLKNGHNVVALANLCPPSSQSRSENSETQSDLFDEDGYDLNSFMYQTVGHTIIPLYEIALGIPLYRQEIFGTAVQTGTTYSHFTDRTFAEDDETESLIPLFKTILSAHPTANALCTGAILSTYQRTRIESVALRLGLTPLAYLWKYPVLPPSTQSSLLQDMQSLGLDARIVKVASGGLDESFLWQNVASEVVFRRVEKAMKRFGTDGDGAVIGEGGEFETIVLDGPAELFKGRITIPDKGRRIVREGGGAAWLDLTGAEIELKNDEELVQIKRCRVPSLFDQRFKDVLDMLMREESTYSATSLKNLVDSSVAAVPNFEITQPQHTQKELIRWTMIGNDEFACGSISMEATRLIEEIKSQLAHFGLESSDIISTIIVLRSMQNFVTVNEIYGTLFLSPNPPSRVTIACGTALRPTTNLIIYLQLRKPSHHPAPTKALHVQSTSYWAPANIGPYSQAVSIPTGTPDDGETQISLVFVAGQIPLVPQSMILPSAEVLSTYGIQSKDEIGEFKLQAVLSLQHLWRIGQDVSVVWWTSVVAYLPSGSPEKLAAKAVIAGKVWAWLHKRTGERESDDEHRDLWEEKHYAGMGNYGAVKGSRALPDWTAVEYHAAEESAANPFFAVEVEELPRGGGIEWQAHSGVVAGPVKLYIRESPGLWTLHVCAVADTAYIVVLIKFTASSVDVKQRRDDALRLIGHDASMISRSHLSYLDVSVEGILDQGCYGGQIPCKSIWNGDGERLAAVLLCEAHTINN